MKIKFLRVIVLTFTAVNLCRPGLAEARGLEEGAASFLLPTTGQAMNGELGATKTKLMAGVEVASITAITVLGFATGGGAIIWWGLGPLLGNHVISAVDAYQGSKFKEDPEVQAQMIEAQRTIDLSRQRRFDREQTYRSDIRDRVRKAGEYRSY